MWYEKSYKTPGNVPPSGVVMGGGMEEQTIFYFFDVSWECWFAYAAIWGRGIVKSGMDQGYIKSVGWQFGNVERIWALLSLNNWLIYPWNFLTSGLGSIACALVFYFIQKYLWTDMSLTFLNIWFPNVFQMDNELESFKDGLICSPSIMAAGIVTVSDS